MKELNEKIVAKIRNYIHLRIKRLSYKNINDDQFRWEYLKNEVRKFSRKISKTLAKEFWEKLRILENKLNLYKQNFKFSEHEDYLTCQCYDKCEK